MARCETCNGAGKIRCPECHGAGVIPCETCDGAGHTACKICKGRGEAPLCTQCQGTGLEVCRRLKAEARTAAIPVVFITAVAASQSIADGFAAGGQDYITKPFCASELSTRIKAQLTLRRSQLQLLEYAKELEEKNAQLQSLLQKVEILVFRFLQLSL